jgi:hypothetical protein
VVRDFGVRVVDAHAAAFLAIAGIAALERLDRAALQLFGELLVEAFDAREFGQLDVRDFL